MASDTDRALRDRVRDESGVVMVIGDSATGKTHTARMLLEDAVAAGRPAAFIDGDVGAATVGPATGPRSSSGRPALGPLAWKPPGQSDSAWS